MSDIGMNASLSAGDRGERHSEYLVFRLLELAIGAGWAPRDCIEFAREAYKLVAPTLPETTTHQVVAAREPSRIDQPGVSEDSPHLEWGQDLESRRNALQTLANQNRTMYEAARVLGISKGLVASTARRLNISFHGIRRLHAAVPMRTGATSEFVNGAKASALVSAATMGEEASKQPVALMKRRCPACNQIFETTEIGDYLCDDCGSGSHIAH